MKTPEEIIIQMYGDGASYPMSYSRNEVYEAMKRYAGQFHPTPTPTEAEINEAAEKEFPNAGMYRQRHGFVTAFQWLQNYQTQGREKPVESGIDYKKLMSQAKDIVAYKSEYADWQQIDCLDLQEYEKDAIKVDMIDDIACFYEMLVCQKRERLQASQPNQAIAVIEDRLKQVKETKHNTIYHGSVLLGQEEILETILKQIKP